MYQISRAIYRELAPYVSGAQSNSTHPGAEASREQVLRSCEAVIERLARDPYCFADPTRTLFYDIRTHFPMSAQRRVHRVVAVYMDIAQRFVAEHPLAGYVEVSGEAPRCRATTRKGDACRRVPLPRNGYCPSHQHLAETEDTEWRLRLKATAATATSAEIVKEAIVKHAKAGRGARPNKLPIAA
jgi:hypothetical protein